MSNAVETSLSPAFGELLRRADRRLRSRLLFESVARALWPGFVAAILLAAVWRLSGSIRLAYAWPGAVALAVLIGAALGRRREDLLAAAAELDRLAGLDAALATGFEAAQGRIRGRFAPAVARQAERLSSGLRADIVSALPSDRSRYLAIPAAVLAGLVLLPSSGTSGAGGERVLLPAGPAAASRAPEAPRRGAVPEELPKGGQAERRDSQTALRAHIESVRRARPSPEQSPAFAPAPGRRAARRTSASGVGTSRAGTGEGAGSPDRMEDASAPAARPSSARAPVDTGEAASLIERFPEYDELVRRYFLGPGGAG